MDDQTTKVPADDIVQSDAPTEDTVTTPVADDAQPAVPEAEEISPEAVAAAESAISEMDEERMKILGELPENDSPEDGSENDESGI